MGLDAATRRHNRVRAGELRHVCTIERKTELPDAMGNLVPTWSPLLTELPCSVRELSGDELWDAAKVKGKAEHVLEMRFVEGLNLKDRFDFEGRTLNIVAIRNPLESDVMQRCFVREEKTPP